jgi:hypothetical protein
MTKLKQSDRTSLDECKLSCILIILSNLFPVHADHIARHPHYGPPGEFYRAIITLSSTTLTLDNKLYKVYAGGMYPRADCCPDAAVEEVIKRYGPRFESNGEVLSSGLMRYWQRGDNKGEEKGWVYVKREEGAVELPKAFWLLEVKEGEQSGS